MALGLHIPPCIEKPPHPLHFPPLEKPLRIQVEGPLTSIQKLLPNVSWPVETNSPPFPLPAGPLLAKLTYQTIYGRDARPEVDGGGDNDDLVVRDEYLGWVIEARPIGHVTPHPL